MIENAIVSIIIANYAIALMASNYSEEETVSHNYLFVYINSKHANTIKYNIISDDEVLEDQKKTITPISNHENIRKTLLMECQNYLLILPKQMGCAICQLAHTIVLSERYKRYLKRKHQIETFMNMLDKSQFCPAKALTYLTKQMKPFTGQYGKNFFQQCQLLLESIEK